MLKSLFKFRIQSIPVFVGFILLLILVRRSQQNWQTLAGFVEDRKYYDLVAAKNGIQFIDKPPITEKDEMEAAISKVLAGAHRNTVFILGESRDAPEIVIQPINKFSEDEIKKGEEVWGDGANYYKIYSKRGLTFDYQGKAYQLVATQVTVNGTRFDLLAFTSLSRTVQKAFQKSLIELTLLLAIVAVIVLVVLTAASRAVVEHSRNIMGQQKSQIKRWWPLEIKLAAANYNAFIDSEALYKIQINQSTSGQMIVRSMGNAQAIIYNPNQAIASISGYTQAELEGRPLNMIVPKEYHQYHFGLGVWDEQLQRHVGMSAYAGGCPFHGHQSSRIVGKDRTVDLLHKNGSIRKVVLGVFYVGKTEPGEDEWVGVVTDVTELTDAIAKAEAFAKDTQNITHIFAHDLKAGEIASAKAGEYVTETAKDVLEYLETAGSLDTSVERSLNFIVKYSGRITASCQNNYALIDQRNKLHDLAERLTPEPHPIQEIFDGVAVAFNRSDGALVFIDDCPGETVAIVDLALFLSALKNLVKNGFAYNDSIDKRIEIKATVRNRDVVFAVSDNGVGFPPEYIESWGRIQGQAARLDPTREGSGTGLYSVRQIIEAHKGATVTLSSEQGVGSVFTVTVGGRF